MARFIHSILAPNQAQAADGEVNIDLPVNPLCAILIHLNPLNETSTISNYTTMVGLLSALDNINVTYRGTSIIDITGGDMVAFLQYASRFDVRLSNLRNTDDERRSLVIPVPLARDLYNPNECFPETKRGELILTLTLDIADTGFDGLRYSVETIELPDASPTHFQRLTTSSQTFAATGNNDVDAPIGNILRGILAFGTTAYTGATPVPTLGELRLLKDNIETHYASTDFEVSRAVSALCAGRLSTYLDHFHWVIIDDTVDVDVEMQEQTNAKHEAYTYLDLDPTRDDQYSLDTKGAGRVHLRVDAEAADAARFIWNEKMDAAEFLRP